MNAKSIAGWLAIALVIWWVIETPTGASHIVSNIGHFLDRTASDISSFFSVI